jgi:hypothetical protein
MFKTILQKIKELNNKQNFINKFKLKEIKIGTGHWDHRSSRKVLDRTSLV